VHPLTTWQRLSKAQRINGQFSAEQLASEQSSFELQVFEGGWQIEFVQLKPVGQFATVVQLS
jgi:hypothetical protein